MFKYYISISVLGVFVIALIITGIIVGGNPIYLRDVQLDDNRLNAFGNIIYKIEGYYRKNGKLPVSLSEISPNINIQDPETKTSFDYKVISPYSYQLCTTFSTDNSKTATNNYNNYESDLATYKIHKKGYDCLTFKLSEHTINSSYNIPTVPLSPSVLNVNSFPQGITMASPDLSYGGTTNYTRTKIGVINTRIDAPLSSVIDGVTYTFSSWSGCNNDTVPDQYCTVQVSGNTVSITATYVISTPNLSPKP